MYLKKSLALLATLLISSSWADTPISCNGVTITLSSAESTIEAKCRVTKLHNDDQIVSGQSATKVKSADPLEERNPAIADLSKISFIADDNLQHNCYYRNNQLLKCNTLSRKSSASN